MSINWKYDMQISEAINVLENTSLSKQQYKDLILSYHILRLNDNKISQSTPKTLDQSQQQKLKDTIKAHSDIFNNQFSQTQNMFQQIQDQNIPQLNESMERVSAQLQNFAQSKSANSTFFSEKSEKYEKYEKFEKKQDSAISGISDYQSELNQLETSIQQYKQKFQVLTNTLKTHKIKFEEEKKKTFQYYDQLIKNIQDIQNQQQQQ
ncbi:unnamed protein product [Paramecium octaurelia]|uniref:Uncharacterized protein n=1 Tax=Paramecium octaurelia TaxID=43137 RepID=A0A8S1VH59_PAROT|nr:unnamed protein product [Paramecium octaurelia]